MTCMPCMPLPLVAALQEGVDFYGGLIDALKAACIEPYITL